MYAFINSARSLVPAIHPSFYRIKIAEQAAIVTAMNLKATGIDESEAKKMTALATNRAAVMKAMAALAVQGEEAIAGPRQGVSEPQELGKVTAQVVKEAAEGHHAAAKRKQQIQQTPPKKTKTLAEATTRPRVRSVCNYCTKKKVYLIGLSIWCPECLWYERRNCFPAHSSKIRKTIFFS